ncbi:unnamed protein product [Dovyalis caffra]|uniref:Uncharacterized protein n=1 Tax=Dovyalis caffra TaxID=77055 RepID=A0AAV1R5W0_9ROSI|nr:unnamed protein product [Dovyalis caffra]
MSPLIPDIAMVPGVGRSGSSPYRRGATAASGSDLSTRQFIQGLKLESTSHQEKKKKTKNEAGSSLPSGSIYGLWILGMVSNALEAKRLRGEGLLIKGRLRGSFKVAS